MLPKLYKCLRHIPGFRDDREWNGQPHVSELSDYLISKVRQHAPEGMQWSIDGTESVSIVYWRDFDGAGNYCAIPMEWLPLLQVKSPWLHELAVVTLRMVSMANEMEWLITHWEDHILDDEYYLLAGDEDPDHMRACLVDLAKYRDNGIVLDYYRLTQKLLKAHTLEILENNLNEYRPYGTIEKAIHKWLISGIDLIKNPAPLSRYTVFDDDYPDCPPLTTGDAINFCWSFHDRVSEAAESFRDDYYQNGGIVEPREMIVYTEKKVLPLLPASRLLKLVAFMKEGRRIYFRHFDKKVKKENKYDRRDED